MIDIKKQLSPTIQFIVIFKYIGVFLLITKFQYINQVEYFVQLIAWLSLNHRKGW